MRRKKPRVIEHGLAPADHPIYRGGLGLCVPLKALLASEDTRPADDQPLPPDASDPKAEG
jgi:hypothetical protein